MECKGVTAYYNSFLENKLITNWFANQLNQSVSKQRGQMQNGCNHASPPTQCAKDCGPYVRHLSICICVLTCSSSCILTVVPYFFEISTFEDSSQPTKHVDTILKSIFFTQKATILDTHGSIRFLHLSQIEKNLFGTDPLAT